MKNVILVLLLLWTSSVSGQINDWSSNFCITGQVMNYQGREYKNIYPAIMPNNTLLNQEMRLHKRRFEYIMQNRTDFKQNSFQNMFPDTVKMTNIYRKSIEGDPKVENYFMKLSKPFLNIQEQKEVYSKAEIMTVASKFFYCDKVSADTTISLHVCIGINGQESSKVKDYTILEAICFEAIFEKMFGFQNMPKYMDDFSNIAKKNSKLYKAFSSKGLDVFLQKVRTETYKEMENNESLRDTIFVFIDKNKVNLPFQVLD